MANLILIRGVPGSGKSTLAKIICDGGYPGSVIFEADMFFVKAGQYNFDRTKLREAHAWCMEMTVAALERDLTAIVSNTFTTSKELKPYFEIAKRFGITPTVHLCQNDWGSIHGVPPDTMEAMRSRFQYDISHLFKGLE